MAKLITFLAVLVLAVPLATAQEAGKAYRIGFLSAPTPAGADTDAFRQGLRERGYVEGGNVLIEWRFAEGRDDRLPGFAAELVRLKVDIIVTVAASAALAAKKTTAEVPIVFTVVPDPVASGFVRTLARPGGNMTGLTAIQTDLAGKRLELVKEAVPSLASVVILANPANLAYAQFVQETRVAARRLGLEVRAVEVRHSSDLEAAFRMIPHEGAPVVVLQPDPLLFTHRSRIVELAAKRRLAVLGWQSELTKSGAMMSYGANTPDIYRRAAMYVDRILKGAKPADLPVEQPTKFELVINLKTAKALGLTIPPALLARADQIIE